MLFFGLTSWLFGVWKEPVRIIGLFYIGYAPTILGSIIGTAWGFLDAFIGGVLLAWLYNEL